MFLWKVLIFVMLVAPAMCKCDILELPYITLTLVGGMPPYQKWGCPPIRSQLKYQPT